MYLLHFIVLSFEACKLFTILKIKLNHKNEKTEGSIGK